MDGINAAAARALGMRPWRGDLDQNDNGQTYPTSANAMLILANDEPLAAMLGYDAFTSQHLIMRAPPSPQAGMLPMPGPYPRPWGSEDVTLTLGYMQRVWSRKFNVQCVEAAMLAEARHRPFHPVCDWLEGLRNAGKHRLDTWLCKAFGCPDDDYHRAIGAKFLIAAVRRVRHPGTKFDTMPVLEGAQGIGKSTACKVLFGEHWFTDSIPEDLASRDAALALLGVWLLEFGEIEHLIRSELETIKAFLSRSTDRYRPPYAKSYVERPRQGVLIGTTNAEDYLRDSSGNRRIWPIKCRFADVDWIAANRDQLWAEAAARENAGESIWLDDTDARAAAGRAQAHRMSEDVWTERIQQRLSGALEVRIPDILDETLLIPRERQGKSQEMRVANILTIQGWERHVVYSASGGKARRVWRPKEGAETPVQPQEDEP